MASREKQTCAYCLQDLKEMINPKQLPCGHVFCLRCLKSNYGSTTAHQCTVCRKQYMHLDFDSLPPPIKKEGDETEDSVTPTVKMRCDRCTDKHGNRPAVKYCIDCGAKSCELHIKHHDGYFEDLHETIDITAYAVKPSQYNKIMICERHKTEVITMACEKCFQYNCTKCHQQNQNNSCNTVAGSLLSGSFGSSSSHQYQPLKRIESDIQSHFEGKIRASTEKLSDIERLEKGAYRTMDTLVEECKTMRAEVTKKCKEQIQLIQNQSAGLIEMINSYEEDKNTEGVDFLTELNTKRDQIEKVKQSTNKFRQDCHVSELVKCVGEKTVPITGVNNTSLGTYTHDKLLHIGGKRKMEVDFTQKHNNYRSHSVRGFGKLQKLQAGVRYVDEVVRKKENWN